MLTVGPVFMLLWSTLLRTVFFKGFVQSSHRSEVVVRMELSLGGVGSSAGVLFAQIGVMLDSVLLSPSPNISEIG